MRFLLWLATAAAEDAGKFTYWMILGHSGNPPNNEIIQGNSGIENDNCANNWVFSDGLSVLSKFGADRWSLWHVQNEGHVSHEQNTMCLIGYGGLL